MPTKDTAISIFSGAMGLDRGFELEGFQVRAVVEKDRAAIETILANRPLLPILYKNGRPAAIEETSGAEILNLAGLRAGAPTVLLGAPPCEPYSTAGRRNGQQDLRADAVLEFVRLIREIRPRFFVLEEVPSFLSAAKRHMPFYDRIALAEEDVHPDSQLGSFFRELMEAFRCTRYALSYDDSKPLDSVLNAADFGVGQKRRRFILIGARDGSSVDLPKPTRRRWVTLRGALRGLDDREPEYGEFPQKWGRYLRLVPPGGCWKDLPPRLHAVVLGGAYDDGTDERTRGKKGGRTGFMRRLSWDNPAPTLVDSPRTKSACLCHPDSDRPLSVREYARIQGFPDHWKFCGSVSAKYRLIGQATPVPLARAVAHQIRARIDAEESPRS